MEKKIVESKSQISLSDLSTLLALFRVNTSELYNNFLLKNLEDVFIGKIYELSYNDIANLIQGYSSKNNIIINEIKKFLSSTNFSQLSDKEKKELIHSIDLLSFNTKENKLI